MSAAELGRLDEMQSDGLLELQPDAITVFPSGRLMIRNICMVFDRYLRTGNVNSRFSRVI